MTILEGTITGVHGFTLPAGVHAIQKPTGNPQFPYLYFTYYGCYISATFSGTYLQADKARIRNVGSSIKSVAGNALSNIQGIVAVSSAAAAPGEQNGLPIFARNVTINDASYDDITLELTDQYGLNQLTNNTLLSTFSYPIQFYVTFVAQNL